MATNGREQTANIEIETMLAPLFEQLPDEEKKDRRPDETLQAFWERRNDRTRVSAPAVGPEVITAFGLEDFLPSSSGQDDLSEQIERVGIAQIYRTFVNKGFEPTLRAGEVQISCPSPHHPDTNPSASMNTDTNLWCCYRCYGEAAGNVFTMAWVAEGNNGTIPRDEFRPLVERMAQRLGIEVPQRLVGRFHVPEAMPVAPAASNGSTAHVGAQDEQAATPSTPRANPFAGALLTIGEFCNLPDPEYLINDLLETDSVALLFGKRESFKSFVALDLAMHVGCGRTWHGRTVKQGSVVYVVAESPRGMSTRAEAWIAHHGHGEEAPVAILPRPVNLFHQTRTAREPDQTAQFIDAVKDMNPALIIIDTLARCAVGAEENSATEMGLVIDNAERIRDATKACVLVVHHPTKDGEGYRGSSAIEGAMTTMVEAKRDGDGPNLKLKCEKQKNAEHFSDIPLTLEDVDLGDRSSLVVADIAAMSAPDELTSAKVLLPTLDDMDEGGGVTTSKLTKAHAPTPERTIQRWAKLLVKHGFATNIGTPARAKWQLTLEGKELRALIPDIADI